MMMLRSSSTPVLGSLISSFSESPNHHQQYISSDQLHGAPQTTPTRSRKLPCFCSKNGGGGSPISGKSLSQGTNNSIRRAQSEGNLHELALDAEELSFSRKTRKSFSKPALETIPSFSIHGAFGVESDDDEDDEEEGYQVEKMRRDDVNYRDYISSAYAGSDRQGKMYVAAGLGISGSDLVGGGGLGGGGGGGRPVAFDMGGGGGDGGGGLRSMEQRFKKMVEENQGNSLVLRNYAQFLYQRKGDTEGAEEYYSRAILADPQDGEVLSQYAMMIWEVHRDEERARIYFERAVGASPQDSHIHAAYASFLWDIGDEEEEEESSVGKLSLDESLLHRSFVASASV